MNRFKWQLILTLLLMTSCGKPIDPLKSLDETAMVYHGIHKSVLSMDSMNMHGSGFQIKSLSGETYIMTNSHVCGKNKELRAKHYDGTIQVVKVLAHYYKHDLCLLEPAKGLKGLHVSLVLNDIERIWVVGYPGFMPMTINDGYYMSEENIPVGVECDANQYNIKRNKFECWVDYISSYITIPIYPGNSGSPVVNKQNKVVGVIFASHSNFHHGSYMVPFQHILNFLMEYENPDLDIKFE